MMREISIFTGSDDLRRALGLLAATVRGGPRDSKADAQLDELADYFGAEEDRHELASWAARNELPAPPALDLIRRLFREELLSSRALAAHRGRNVYSGGKAALWQALWLPYRDALVVGEETLALAGDLIALRTQAGGAGVEDMVGLLQQALIGLEFTVEIHRETTHPPTIVAHRPARGRAGRVVIYNHYDAEDPDIQAWETDPWVLTELAGRLFGVAVGDNKGALAQRLVTLRTVTESPEILWVIQGEEEVGSPLLRRLAPRILSGGATVWLDENGYFEVDGTQRMLARTIGMQPDSSLPPDPDLWGLIHELDTATRRRFGIEHQVDCRSLNKSFFAEGCPFNLAIPRRGRYLALGINDSASAIHAPNESVPMWTFPVHDVQFRTVLRWAGRAQ